MSESNGSPGAPARRNRPFFVFLVFGLGFLGAFAAWSAFVFTMPAIAERDRALAESMSTRHDPVLRWVMIVATYCGGVRANMALAAAGALWMWRHHRRRFAIAWLLIALGGGLIVLELKETFDRDRPDRTLRDPSVRQENESYPSGRAMGSVVGYGMLAFVLWQYQPNWRRRGLIVLGIAVWVVVIGLSRVYLRAHWLSDVIGGWLLGAAYTSLCMAVYLWRKRSRPAKLHSSGCLDT